MSSGRATLLVCLVVMVVGAFYSSQLNSTKRFKDETDYVRCGYHMVYSGLFSMYGENPTAYRPPGYPALIGTVFLLGGNEIAIRMANYSALCATILLASRFLRRRGYPRGALVAVILTAIYPPFLYTASTFYPQTLGALLLVGLLNLLPLEPRVSPVRGVAIGLVAGALTLTIPIFLAGIALVFAWVLYRGRARAMPGILVASVVLVGCVGSWSYRNYLVFDAFVPISTNAGRNLLLGNSEHTTATSGVNVDISEFEAHAHRFSEPSRDRRYRRAAVTWIKRNPGKWLRLYTLKVLNHFNVWNNYATDKELGQLESIVLALFYIPLLAIFLWRLARLKHTPFWPTESALVLLYFGMALATALFFTRIRFRLPLDHLLIWSVAVFVAGDRRPGESPSAASVDQ